MKPRTSRTRWTASLIALQLLCMGGVALAAEPKVSDEAQRVQDARDAERTQIQKQRTAIEQRLNKEEATCYKQFVVDSCLREARAKARAEDGELRGRELRINEAERREKAEERRKFISESEEAQRDKAEAGQAQIREANPEAQAASREQTRQQRADEAQQRAQQQKSREAANAQEQAKRQSTQPSKVERARMQYEAKQRKAAERRSKHEKDMQDSEKLGKPTPAPLPDPSAPSVR